MIIEPLEGNFNHIAAGVQLTFFHSRRREWIRFIAQFPEVPHGVMGQRSAGTCPVGETGGGVIAGRVCSINKCLQVSELIF